MNNCFKNIIKQNVSKVEAGSSKIPVSKEKMINSESFLNLSNQQSLATKIYRKVLVYRSHQYKDIKVNAKIRFQLIYGLKEYVQIHEGRNKKCLDEVAHIVVLLRK